MRLTMIAFLFLNDSNCCFEQSRVDFLLSDALKLVLAITLPLIGTGDTYDEEVSVLVMEYVLVVQDSVTCFL